MAQTRALGMTDAHRAIELEKSPTPCNLEIYRVNGEVLIEKKTFDNYIDRIKKDKGIKFSLTGYRLHKVDRLGAKPKTYYAFQKTTYKPFAILLKMPAWNNVPEKSAL